MLTSEQAIARAFEYIEALGPQYLEQPQNIRLEAIQRFEDEWVVVLSYLTAVTPRAVPETNPLLKALTVQRRFKEFEINAESGEVLSMRNPEDRPVPKSAS